MLLIVTAARQLEFPQHQRRNVLIDGTRIRDSKLARRPSSSRLSLSRGGTARFEPSGIIGGYIPSDEVSEHLAHITVHYINDRIDSCTGTIINKYVVLTAAHCFLGTSGQYKVRYVEVSIGRNKNKGDTYYAHYVDVSSAYDPSTSVSDLAFVEVTQAFREPYRTVRIEFSRRAVPFDTTVYTAGFGLKRLDKPAVKIAREAPLKRRKLKRCKRKFAEGLAEKWTRKDFICATDYCGKSECTLRGACFGDNGGPLFLKNESTDSVIQLGVLSFVNGCAQNNSVSMFINLATHETFIQQYINGTLNNWEQIFTNETLR